MWCVNPSIILTSPLLRIYYSLKSPNSSLTLELRFSKSTILPADVELRAYLSPTPSLSRSSLEVNFFIPLRYTCVIVSDVFQGIPLLKRHRMINDLLKDEIAALHAFSQKCLTASQWEEQKAQIK